MTAINPSLSRQMSRLMGLVGKGHNFALAWANPGRHSLPNPSRLDPHLRRDT